MTMTPRSLFERPTVAQRASATYLSMVVAIDSEGERLRDMGKVIRAAEYRGSARIAHSAWLAEEENPIPSDLPWHDCDECNAYLQRRLS